MIIRLIITIAIIYFLYKLLRGVILLLRGNTTNPVDREITNREDLVEDPWCHTYVPQSTAYQAIIEGRKVYFCSRDCYEKFREKSREQQG
jgi:YHS domain-containing protein